MSELDDAQREYFEISKAARDKRNAAREALDDELYKAIQPAQDRYFKLLHERRRKIESESLNNACARVVSNMGFETAGLGSGPDR
jgi:hypothetical protein